MKYLQILFFLFIIQSFFSCKKESAKIAAIQPPIALKSIVIKNDTISLQQGTQATINYTLSPINAVADTSLVFTSSDTTIVSVKKPGAITAKKVGTAFITISNADASVTAKCLINVLPVAVTGITINVASLNILIGTSDSLSAIVQPLNAANKKVVWSSSDNSIASITTDGRLKAIALGSVTITATTPDGKISGTCTMQVVSIGFFVTATAYYNPATVNNGPGERIYFKIVNNSLYPVNITEWWLYVDNGDIGINTIDGYAPLETLQRGENFTSPQQYFSIGQYDPGVTSVQDWPINVFFNCLGKHYEMALTAEGQTIVQLRD